MTPECTMCLCHCMSLPFANFTLVCLFVYCASLFINIETSCLPFIFYLILDAGPWALGQFTGIEY